ncbi:sigma-70 family RNA polymerase sigma factor [Parabacteroides acidifaciens]|nr:sigma-70 family RNA polymerase sigma factor [Parabacteroides acidifaciens]MBC8602687.1 sigma-70 family RNA polymerase sigma factor [Parabacteroides acidifaciens]
MTEREVITELIRKECEAYQLIGFGLLSSVEEGVERLLPLLGKVDSFVFNDYTRFSAWRKEVLHLFYKQLDYAGFIRREGLNAPFRRFLFYLKKRITGYLREQCKEPTIDKDLAVPPETLAFKLSAMLDDELFRNDYPWFLSADSPAQLEEVCRESCRNRFPIGLDGLLVRLKKDDPEFWNGLYLKIKKIAQNVTSGQSVSILYRKEILQDTWSDTSLLLHDKVMGETVPEFETSLHFRNYIARICLNKCREAFRKHNLPDISLTETGEVTADLFQSAGEEIPETCLLANGLADIDCENEDEVGRCLTVILWDKLEPWYTELTRDIEEKTELIFLHYVEGLSYDAIAAIKGVDMPGKEQDRLAGKLRQDVVRTRRTLKLRFVELLKRNKKHG